MTELRALIARATPGPWHVEGDEWGGDIYGPDREADYVAVDHEGLQPSVRSRADADLIVELRNHAAELLDAHDRMAGALTEVEALRKVRAAAVGLVTVWDAPQPRDSDLDSYYEAGLTTDEAEQALRDALEPPDAWACDWQPDDLNPGPECPYCTGRMCARFDGLGGCMHGRIARHGYETVARAALAVPKEENPE